MLLLLLFHWRLYIHFPINLIEPRCCDITRANSVFIRYKRLSPRHCSLFREKRAFAVNDKIPLKQKKGGKLDTRVFSACNTNVLFCGNTYFKLYALEIRQSTTIFRFCEWNASFSLKFLIISILFAACITRSNTERVISSSKTKSKANNGTKLNHEIVPLNLDLGFFSWATSNVNFQLQASSVRSQSLKRKLFSDLPRKYWNIVLKHQHNFVVTWTLNTQNSALVFDGVVHGPLHPHTNAIFPRRNICSSLNAFVKPLMLWRPVFCCHFLL